MYYQSRQSGEIFDLKRFYKFTIRQVPTEGMSEDLWHVFGHPDVRAKPDTLAAFYTEDEAVQLMDALAVILNACEWGCEDNGVRKLLPVIDESSVTAG